MLRLRLFFALGLLTTLPACSVTQQSRIDAEIRALGVHDADMDPPHAVDALPPQEARPTIPKAGDERAKDLPPPPAFAAMYSAKVQPFVVEEPARWLNASFQQESPAAAAEPIRRTLKIPDVLPGANAPAIRLPTFRAEREKVLNEIYPPIPALPVETPAEPGPEGKPLSLTDLQRLGETYSPAIKSAIAGVETAKGNALQAGMYPNPTLAWEHNTVETGGGYPGGYIDQVIVTGGKLKLKQAAATMDLLNAKLALKRARSDLRTQIRSSYFAHLVAYENIKVSDALYRFTEEIYHVQLDLLDKGFAAAYEPMQLRPAVLQAQVNRMQARNQYLASWRRLAAALGLPKMPLSEVEGRVDLPIPVYEYAEIRARVDQHTDVLSAINSVQNARYNLDLARATPIPNVELQFLLQKDYSTPPFQIAESTRASITLPAWDRNKGAIHQAKWQLSQAAVGVDRARNVLLTRLADAFQRYQSGRRNVELAALQIKDQVRAYRGLYERRQQVPADVAFTDLVTAQQTLATYITSYIAALGLQWQAAIDLASILQEDNLFHVGRKYDVTAVPNLSVVSPPMILKSGPSGCAAKAFPIPVGKSAPVPWQGEGSQPAALHIATPSSPIQEAPDATSNSLDRRRAFASPADVPALYRRKD